MSTSCPLCPQKRTSSDTTVMSALCHKATFAPAAKLRLIGPHPHLVVGSTNHLTSDCSNRSLLSPSAVSRLPLQRQQVSMSRRWFRLKAGRPQLTPDRPP